MILNSFLSDIQSPPVVKLKNMAKPFLSDPDFIDLSQAVPSWSPPKIILDTVKKNLGLKESSFYTPGQGIPELRNLLSEKFETKNHISTSASNIIITCGANQAYLMSIMTLINPGDEVILLEPYYFNHIMAIQMCGGIPVISKLDYKNGFKLDIDEIKSKITDKTKAITLVNPSNPTGVFYNQNDLKPLLPIIEEHDLILISDETYEYFIPESEYFSIGSIDTISDKIFTIGTFSKTFSLTGWRVGYINIPKNFVSQMMKIQDTMVICSPNISQQAAICGMKNSFDWVRNKSEEIIKIINWTKEYKFKNQKFEIVSSGAFFAYIKHNFKCDSYGVSEKLLKDYKILVIPGEVSGHSQQQFLRIAVGGVTIKKLETAFNRMAND